MLPSHVEMQQATSHDDRQTWQGRDVKALVRDIILRSGMLFEFVMSALKSVPGFAQSWVVRKRHSKGPGVWRGTSIRVFGLCYLRMNTQAARLASIGH